MVRAPSAFELLEVWEDGRARTPTYRALALLMAMLPEVSQDALTALSIGQRDAELLRLREALWGPRMAAVSACPGCRETLELTLDTGAMLSASNRMPPNEMSLNIAGYAIRFRLPTTVDVAAAEAEVSLESARSLLLDRCLLSAGQGAAAINSAQLPPEVVASIVKSMAEADPLADIQLKLHCPSCQLHWRAAFDIVSFLWTEIEAWARRILSDVHTLARAYGWRERDILSLSPARRQFYLDMVGA
jgi:hypothetical protein